MPNYTWPVSFVFSLARRRKNTQDKHCGNCINRTHYLFKFVADLFFSVSEREAFTHFFYLRTQHLRSSNIYMRLVCMHFTVFFFFFDHFRIIHGAFGCIVNIDGIYDRGRQKAPAWSVELYRQWGETGRVDLSSHPLHAGPCQWRTQLWRVSTPAIQPSKRNRKLPIYNYAKGAANKSEQISKDEWRTASVHFGRISVIKNNVGGRY